MKIADLNFEQSLLRRHLIFKTSWSYKFDLIFQIIVNVVLWLFMSMILVNYATYDRNGKSFVYVFVVFMLIFNYLLYLKLMEKKLSIIRTNNTAGINREYILAFAKQEDWSIRKKSKNIVVTFEDCGDRGLGNNKQLTRVFLLSANDVLFTVFTERNRVNFPGLFDRRDVRSDLSKVFANRPDTKNN
ncbi:MAG: hypothetical protein JNM21_12705 [Taibaiella sp.]|nr:hypothetical protein [Taibaiella sp.]